MPGANQKTRISHRKQRVRGVNVIEFIRAPHYRGNDVDISAELPVRYFGPTTLYGNAAPGHRSIVEHVSQVSGKCKVLSPPGTYKVRQARDGEQISIGIEEV
jgi:hypothetical protein